MELLFLIKKDVQEELHLIMVTQNIFGKVLD